MKVESSMEKYSFAEYNLIVQKVEYPLIYDIFSYWT